MMIMNDTLIKGRRNSSSRFLICSFCLSIIVFQLIISISAAGGGGSGDHKDEHKNPEKIVKKSLNAAERAIGITTPLSPWTTVRSWFKLAWMNLKPPDDSGRIHNEQPSGPKDVMTEAVTKTFESSKETAKQTAKAAGDAIHKTAEKVKETVYKSSSSDDDSHGHRQAEL